jgi:hypothetical protein
MMEEELIKIWQSSPNQERIKFEKSRLIIDMQSSMDKFHRAIKNRDLREQIGIAIVIPAFAYSAYAIPFLLTKLASVLIIIWAIYIAFRLRNAKKHRPGAFFESYLEYLHKTREYLRIQKQMMDNTIYWYILPGISLTMLFVLGFSGEPGRSKIITRMAIFNVVLAVVTYFMNKGAVQKEFVPRLKKVDELIQVMEQP